MTLYVQRNFHAEYYKNYLVRTDNYNVVRANYCCPSYDEDTHVYDRYLMYQLTVFNYSVLSY